MGTIINRVSAVAGEKRMQIADLAKAADVSYETSARYWNDKAKGIRFSTLAALCDLLECTPNDLFMYVPNDKGSG